MKKAKIFNLIISIAAPILLVTAVVIIISYGWYVRKQQIATIDANAKSLAVDYTFDGNEATKDVLTYQVENLVFFDNDSEFEYGYLDDMKITLSLKLHNKSENPVTYTITFTAIKSTVTDQTSGDTTSIAYVDCIFTEIPEATSTIKTINSARVSSPSDTTTNIITYTDSSTERTAIYDSGTATIAKNDDNSDNDTTNDETTLVLCLYGVQEMDDASNEPFLYNTYPTALNNNTYAFTLTIEAVPQGAATEDDNTNTNNTSND